MTPDKIYAYSLKWQQELEPIRKGLTQAANKDESLQPTLYHLNAAIKALSEWYHAESKKRGN